MQCCWTVEREPTISSSIYMVAILMISLHLLAVCSCLTVMLIIIWYLCSYILYIFNRFISSSHIQITAGYYTVNDVLSVLHIFHFHFQFSRYFTHAIVMSAWSLQRLQRSKVIRGISKNFGRTYRVFYWRKSCVLLFHASKVKYVSQSFQRRCC